MHSTTGANNNEGQFQDPDPAVPTPGTVIDAPWLNGVQGELLAIILAASIVPSAADATQVLQALRSGLALTPAVHYVGDPSEPIFLSASGPNGGWANVSGARKLAFWRDAAGMVHVEGTVIGNTHGGGSEVFFLPAAYAPLSQVGGIAVASSAQNSACTATVLPGGGGGTAALFISGPSTSSDTYFVQVAYYPGVAVAP
jgi:hypothetical protein